MYAERRTKPEARDLEWGTAVLLVALLAAVACSGSGGGSDQHQPTPPAVTTSSSPSISPTPSPTATMIGDQLVPLEEVAAIEQAVRDYFAAFAASDFRGLKGSGADEVKTLADWQEILNDAFMGTGVLKPESATVESVNVVSVAESSATAEIEGELEETYLEESTGKRKLVSLDISGSVELVRSTKWRVSSYQREGRSTAKQIYTKVRGAKSSQGVTLTVTGVDLRPKGAVLVVTINNGSGLVAGASKAIITLGSGKQYSTAIGSSVIVLEVKAGKKATTGFYFPKSLPTNTKELDFSLDLLLGCDPVCNTVTTITVSVQLVD